MSPREQLTARPEGFLSFVPGTGKAIGENTKRFLSFGQGGSGKGKAKGEEGFLDKTIGFLSFRGGNKGPKSKVPTAATTAAITTPSASAAPMAPLTREESRMAEGDMVLPRASVRVLADMGDIDGARPWPRACV